MSGLGTFETYSKSKNSKIKFLAVMQIIVASGKTQKKKSSKKNI